MLYVLVYCGLIVVASLGIEVVYENMEQLSGFEVFGSTLRVRKFNRTTTVMNGTLFFKVDMNDTYEVNLELFYSRLGNQQFNHYPMKLPAQGMCKFMRDLEAQYRDSFTEFHNFLDDVQCPYKARMVNVLDAVFPSKSIPPTFPKGLWKALITTKVDNVERTRFELTVKAYSNTFF